MLVPPTEGQDILADYASVGLTLSRHPLSLIREQLRRRGVTLRATPTAPVTAPLPTWRASSPTGNGLPVPMAQYS